MPYNSRWKKRLENITKTCFAGFLGLTSVTSCVAGKFEVVRLNNAAAYEQVHSNEDIRKVPFAYLNAADLRGNTLSLFTFISKETALQRANAVGIYLNKEGIDFIGFGETDYKETWKTGFTDQPIEIAKATGHNYVVIDQYMRGLLIPWTTGNAMISKYPLKAVHRHLYGEDQDLDSRLGHLFKDFIHVKVKVGKRELNVILTHLDDEDDSTRRKKELKELTDYVNEEILEENPRAYIALMLDANTGKDSPEMKNFIASGIFHPPEENYGIPTHRSNNPARDLSHVMTTINIRIEDYDRFCLKDSFDKYISDHCGVKGKFVFY